MNTDTYPKTPANQLLDDSMAVGRTVADAASNTLHTLSTTLEDGAERTKDYAQQAVDATKGAAKDMYQSASAKAEDMLVSSKEYVRQNPFPVALGTLVTGLAFGYLIGLMHREPPTLRNRLFC